jgi:hypothetical protein
MSSSVAVLAPSDFDTISARSNAVVSDSRYQKYRYEDWCYSPRWMELQHLRHFCAIAEHGSFAMAARQ